jgi:hypothetical protein
MKEINIFVCFLQCFKNMTKINLQSKFNCFKTMICHGFTQIKITTTSYTTIYNSSSAHTLEKKSLLKRLKNKDLNDK